MEKHLTPKSSSNFRFTTRASLTEEMEKLFLRIYRSGLLSPRHGYSQSLPCDNLGLVQELFGSMLSSCLIVIKHVKAEGGHITQAGLLTLLGVAARRKVARQVERDRNYTHVRGSDKRFRGEPGTTAFVS